MLARFGRACRSFAGVTVNSILRKDLFMEVENVKPPHWESFESS
jgi:hypothetical protein